MLRLTLVVALVACDKGPIQEHRIHYVHSGFGGSEADIRVDLDTRTFVGRDRRNVKQAALSEADAKLFRDLASCARDEQVDPTQVFDQRTMLILDGDQRREITHGLPTRAPCTAKLEQRLDAYAR